MSDNKHEQKAQVEREFSARAEAYVASATHARGDDLARLVELADPQPDTVALDVATGGGHVALALSRKAAEVVASDLSQQMLNSASAFIQSQGQTNVRFVHADTEALPFNDNTFDLVTCRIAPHHFSDVAQAAKEWARVLKPGGKVVLEDSVVPEDKKLDKFMNTVEKIRDYTHERSYTEKEWRGFFEAAGLHIAHSEVWDKRHIFKDWMERGAMLDRDRDWQRVEKMLREASEEVKAQFGIELGEGGSPVSFADQKLMLVAHKPE